MKKTVYISLLFFFLAMKIPLLFSNNIDSKIDSLVQEIEKTSFSQGINAYKMVDELCQLSNHQSGNVHGKVWYLYARSIVNYAQGVNDTALIFDLKNCIVWLETGNLFFEKALMQYALAYGYISKGNYAEAFTQALHVLEQFQKQNNQKFTGKTLAMLGNICSFIKNYKMSDDYYQQASLTVNMSQIDFYLIRLNRYSLLAYINQIDASIDSITTFIPALKSFSDPGPLATAYVNLGGFYAAKGMADTAFYYFTILQKLLNTVDNKKIMITLYQNFGFYYTNIDNFYLAESYFQKSKKIAIENKNLSQLFYASYGLSYMYEKWDVPDSAFVYLKQCYMLRDQLDNTSKAIEAYQAYISMSLESSQKELKIAEQSISLKNRQFVIIMISAGSMILLTILLLLVMFQKRRLRESENRDLTERLNTEKQIQQLQEEQLDSKIREIASYSLHLSEKTNTLQQISNLTQKPAQGQEEFDAVNAQINQIIKANLGADHDWKNFMLHFDKVHPSFFDKLKSHCNELTENNLRLCAYFRIGLSHKEVAQILNISTETCRTIRYRLKKKLGLGEEEHLDDFLRKI